MTWYVECPYCGWIIEGVDPERGPEYLICPNCGCEFWIGDADYGEL